MFSSALFALAAAGIVSGAALPAEKAITAVKSEGSEVVALTKWQLELKAAGVLLERPDFDWDFLNFTAEPDTPEELQKRQSCGNTRATRVDREETFVDWDVQMSSVACSRTAAIDIFVMSGWSVANSISVSVGLDPKVIKDWLGLKFSVDYGRTWTSSQNNQNKFTVPVGSCGCMVSRPITTRRYGSVFEGCIGSQKQIGTFSADSRGKGNYNGLEWPEGSVEDCIKAGAGPGMSRCHGGGNFK